MQGDNTPVNAEPTTLRKEGKKKGHTSQTLPRPSQEMLEHSAEYEALKMALAPLMEWQRKTVSLLLELLSSDMRAQ